MNSPFDSVMATPVLDVRGLARLMRHHSARAVRDARPGCRDDEEDAVLLGRLILLDELAWRADCEEMSGAETKDLRAAANELGRAVESLTKRMAAVPNDGGESGLTDSEEEGGR